MLAVRSAKEELVTYENAGVYSSDLVDRTTSHKADTGVEEVSYSAVMERWPSMLAVLLRRWYAMDLGMTTRFLR